MVLNMLYIFRNLPCNIVPDDELWYISGNFQHENGFGSGVLEWCYDENDAKAILSQMLQDNSFSNLQSSAFMAISSKGK